MIHAFPIHEGSPSFFDFVVRLTINIGRGVPSMCTGIAVTGAGGVGYVVTAKHCCGGFPGCYSGMPLTGCVMRGEPLKTQAHIVGVLQANPENYREWRPRDVAILVLDRPVVTKKAFKFSFQLPRRKASVASYGLHEDGVPAPDLRVGQFSIKAVTPSAGVTKPGDGTLVELVGEQRTDLPGAPYTGIVGGDSGAPVFWTRAPKPGQRTTNIVYGVVSAAVDIPGVAFSDADIASYQDNLWAQKRFARLGFPIDTGAVEDDTTFFPLSSFPSESMSNASTEVTPRSGKDGFLSKAPTAAPETNGSTAAPKTTATTTTKASLGEHRFSAGSTAAPETTATTTTKAGLGEHPFSKGAPEELKRLIIVGGGFDVAIPNASSILADPIAKTALEDSMSKELVKSIDTKGIAEEDVSVELYDADYSSRQGNSRRLGESLHASYTISLSDLLDDASQTGTAVANKMNAQSPADMTTIVNAALQTAALESARLHGVRATGVTVTATAAF